MNRMAPTDSTKKEFLKNLGDTLYGIKRKIPFIRHFFFQRNIFGYSAIKWKFYFHTFEYNEEIRLWTLYVETPWFNNHVPYPERSEKWKLKHEQDLKLLHQYNPPFKWERRGRNTMFDIKYRWLALRHGKNPFSARYWDYERKF